MDIQVFNLAFGDWNEEIRDIDDFIVTDNKDTTKVLGTVVQAISDFTDRYPNKIVYAMGSSAARNRLYQMNINKYRHEIDPLFYVYGQIPGGSFIEFKAGINFTSFILKRKNK